MKPFAFIQLLCLGLIFSSCQEISFPEAQPAGVASLNEIPKNLQGRYLIKDDKGGKDTDTLFVESWGYHFKDQKDNDWLGKGALSDSLVIKTYQGYYFVNFKIGNQWVLRLVKPKSSGALQFSSINIGNESKRKSVVSKLSRKFTVKEVNRKDDTFYQIAPTKEQLMGLIKEGYFTSEELPKIK